MQNKESFFIFNMYKWVNKYRTAIVLRHICLNVTIYKLNVLYNKKKSYFFKSVNVFY